MQKHLHIICLNVPYPVDYGGVFDLFYKLPALQKQGVSIHLHCFEYGRGHQPELEKFCASLHYYKRLSGLLAISWKLPYIVSGRRSPQLIERLLQDDHPILMEGVHCTFLLNDERFRNRKLVVRLHNVEHVYYKNLFYNSTSALRKIYYAWEARLLEKYEKKIAALAEFWTVIETDVEVYRKLGARNIKFLPLFLPPWQVKILGGQGSYCLYHGDLSVPENEKAAGWLLDTVFSKLELPFVVAGKNPSPSLVRKLERSPNTRLVANPDNEEMQRLIAEAQVNIIPSFNATGIKLKLVNALFNGRHCVVNEATVAGTGLQDACVIAKDEKKFVEKVSACFQLPFSQHHLQTRQQVLNTLFDNDANARKVVQWIWE